MKFAHYYPGAAGEHSGVVAAIAQWTHAMLDAAEQVVVLHHGAPPEPARYGAAELRQVRDIGRGRPTRVPVGLDKALHDVDVLVLHEAWFTANLVAARAARRAGVPYVVVPHGVFEPTWIGYLRQPRRLRRALEASVLRGAAAAHVWFPAEAEHVRRIEPATRCVIAPPGFDVPAERWRPGGDYLAWYGRYAVRNKGIDMLLYALSTLPAACRPRLRMHGVDYEGGLAYTKGLVDALGLGDWVRVSGPIRGADKRDFVLGSAGFVHPSRWDCIPIAVAENLALGVPCLVSDRINLAPALSAERAALVTELDTDMLAAGLIELSERGAELSGRGREFVTNHLSWRDIVPHYLDQIEDVIGVGAR
ncbi:glycosyltransferase [Haloechinothrix sp. YIM 98757]|uniref:Glycosyltransferase n=1 Tax=Haloechinothrix aidingensis TaxID=2752311 RepID=A0A838A1N4_9PSEU|nr:glycosyltransferase [Haloechinothrix aidingensis]MBA0125063.1 glycosyltransferase [Haloechinothrix aidingensis]